MPKLVHQKLRDWHPGHGTDDKSSGLKFCRGVLALAHVPSQRTKQSINKYMFGKGGFVSEILELKEYI
jgi:hypothetical protein